jgi:hypothetical protein
MVSKTLGRSVKATSWTPIVKGKARLDGPNLELQLKTEACSHSPWFEGHGAVFSGML